MCEAASPANGTGFPAAEPDRRATRLHWWRIKPYVPQPQVRTVEADSIAGEEQAEHVQRFVHSPEPSGRIDADGLELARILAAQPDTELEPPA